MHRKLDRDFIAHFKKGGKYDMLLSAIKEDPELSVEIRINSEIKVYYTKGLVLTLSKKGETLLSDGYCRDIVKPVLDLNAPEEYLDMAKGLIRKHSRKVEFTIQQKIAASNQSSDNEYFVVDMEWQYPQSDIPEEDRLNKSRIDIVAIERSTNDIVLFELKQGTGSLFGGSGVDGHYLKSALLMQNRDFCLHLEQDVRNILSDKVELGLIDYSVPNKFGRIKQMFIFAYERASAREVYEKDFADALEKLGVSTIYIDTRDNDYGLQRK